MKKNLAIDEFLKNSIKDSYFFECIDVPRRELYFRGDVDDYNVELTIRGIDILESIDDKKPVTIFLNSNGGDVTSCLLFYDMLKSERFKVKVNIIVRGNCMSAATVILLAATGKRKMMKNATIMFHQITSWSYGKLGDEEKRIEWIKKIQNDIVGIYAKHTKIKDIKEWKKILGTDSYFSAEESLKYGFVDEIIKNK